MSCPVTPSRERFDREIVTEHYETSFPPSKRDNAANYEVLTIQLNNFIRLFYFALIAITETVDSNKLEYLVKVQVRRW